MEELSTTSPLFLEKAADRAAILFRSFRVPFLSSIFFGLLAYGFAITNKLINHDEAHSLFIKGGTVSSGRWGLGILDTIFPNYSMPWIYGLLTIVLVAVGICILVSLFSIRNRLLQGLLAGSIMVFPSLIGLYGYMFTSCSFALSFLLSIASAAFIQKRRIPFVLLAACCLVFSLSIYQSYVSMTAGLLVLLLIRQLLTGSDPLAVLKQGIFYVVFLVACMVTYYLSNQIIFRITDTELGSYASGYFTFTPSAIFNGAILAYRNFYRFFSEGLCGLIPTGFSRMLHMILLGISVILVINLCLVRKYSVCTLLLLTLLLIVLPLAINCMYMITAEDSIHTLVLYGFVNLYICILILADLTLDAESNKYPIRMILNLLTGIFSLVIVINTYIANQAFLNLYLRYENAYAFYTSLAADIKMQPEFTEDTVLAVIGTYQQPEFYTEQFTDVHSITGVYGFVPDNYSKKRFLEYYLGITIPFASSEEIAQISSSFEFEEMPVYPYYGSLRTIGDYLVVKLS